MAPEVLSISVLGVHAGLTAADAAENWAPRWQWKEAHRKGGRDIRARCACEQKEPQELSGSRQHPHPAAEPWS